MCPALFPPGAPSELECWGFWFGVLPNSLSSEKSAVVTSWCIDAIPLVTLCVRGREGRVSAKICFYITNLSEKQKRGCEKMSPPGEKAGIPAFWATGEPSGTKYYARHAVLGSVGSVDSLVGLVDSPTNPSVWTTGRSFVPQEKGPSQPFSVLRI